MWNMYWSKNWAQSVFRLSLVKPKPKLSPQPIRRKENTLKSQGEVKVKPSKLPKARETRVTKLRLVLVLHLIGWEESPFVFKANHSARWSTNNAISIYYRHSVENCFYCLNVSVPCCLVPSLIYRYIFFEKLSPADRERTHILSSFFYKRLTQRSTSGSSNTSTRFVRQEIDQVIF